MDTPADFHDIHLSEVPFLVVDVETTGPSGKDNRITEIACIVVRDGEIIEEFSSLVNPHQHIPTMVSQITGISNGMVYSAPETPDVMRRLRPLFAQPYAVFVAHNVAFDWSFVWNTFTRENLAVRELPRLCTYKLAKRLFPKRTKLNLGALAGYFDISIANRHRAHGDAFATAQTLIRMLDLLQEQFNVQTLDELLTFQNKRLDNFKKIPKSIQALQEQLRLLPDEPGVYFFRDLHDNILYIGKAKSLKNRVNSYFLPSAQHTGKIKDLVRQVRDIQWQTTGTELSALLLESKEIKTHKPQYNTLIKKYRRYPFLRLGAPAHGFSTSDADFKRLDIRFEIEDDGAEYFGPFGSRGSAEAVVDIINRTFFLRKCNEPFTPSDDFTPCFYYQIKRCHAPCALLQSREEYERETDTVRKFLSGERIGIVAALKTAMQESSERLEFEEAALLRNRMKELERIFFRQRQISSSINDNNVIIVIPTEEYDKKVEVFFIRHGRLKFQRLVGKKLPMKELERALRDVYGESMSAPSHAGKEEIDEIRIIASWIYQHRNDGLFLYMQNTAWEQALESLADILYKALTTPQVYKEAEEFA
ncbi:MAG: DEDD exonuclease domain-containing protein [Candidatus Kapabacteria bacterium]|jgi:DNA polymerase-3 subunit epsilon|nr:DEDD exonuclease domain-containing protein [Candidatus Kapabacteria bacterium]